MKFAPVAALAIGLAPARAAAQLPFDVVQEDLLAVDTTAMRWQALSTSVGGVEGELRYVVGDVTEGECRAMAVLGMLRLRNYYLKQQGERPVTLRMRLLCGAAYRGYVEYDGVTLRFELRDRATGELLYEGRRRGLP